MRSAVMLINFNRIEATKMCLYTHFDRVKTPHKLVLLDNGSQDGTREFIEGLPDKIGNVEIDKILNEKNTVFGKVLNDFFEKYKDFDYVGWIPQDVIIDLDWVKISEEYLDALPELGLIMSRMNDCDRGDPQAPFTYHNKNGKSVILTDWAGVVPIGNTHLLRPKAIVDVGKCGEGWQMGSIDWYYQAFRDKGWMTGWTNEFLAIGTDRHPILSLESTKKTQIYRDWCRRFKRGELAEVPPENMYEGKTIV